MHLITDHLIITTYHGLLLFVVEIAVAKGLAHLAPCKKFQPRVSRLGATRGKADYSRRQRGTALVYWMGLSWEQASDQRFSGNRRYNLPRRHHVGAHYTCRSLLTTILASSHALPGLGVRARSLICTPMPKFKYKLVTGGVKGRNLRLPPSLPSSQITAT